MKKLSCDNCPAQCCKYVTVHIDKPTTKKEWDLFIWYLHHKDILIYVDHEDDWMLEFKTKCKNLQEDNKCNIYEERPNICRNHKAQECEFFNKDSPYKILFKTVEDLRKYIEKNKILIKFK